MTDKRKSPAVNRAKADNFVNSKYSNTQPYNQGKFFVVIAFKSEVLS